MLSMEEKLAIYDLTIFSSASTSISAGAESSVFDFTIDGLGTKGRREANVIAHRGASGK